MQPRKKSLTDCLPKGTITDAMQQAFVSADIAKDLLPLSPGEYPCRVLTGELVNARTGTPGYKVAFEVTEGENVGRRLFLDLWLTPAAMPYTKRDLAKIGVTELAQCKRPLPPGMLATVRVSVRKDDDGNTFNRVRSFDVTGVEKADAFAPKDLPKTEGQE